MQLLQSYSIVVPFHDCRLRDFTSRSLFASALPLHAVWRFLCLYRSPQVWSAHATAPLKSSEIPRSLGPVLVVSQHFSTMSSLADRQVCVTGGATCPDWTPLRVSIPRAQHAVSMWMFMEMVHHPPRVHAFCFKQLLVLPEVQRQALRHCVPEGLQENFRRVVSSSLSISAWPVLSQKISLTIVSCLSNWLVSTAFTGTVRIRFPQYKTPASSSALFTS